jgi:hypothetical protein
MSSAIVCISARMNVLDGLKNKEKCADGDAANA